MISVWLWYSLISKCPITRNPTGYERFYSVLEQTQLINVYLLFFWWPCFVVFSVKKKKWSELKLKKILLQYTDKLELHKHIKIQHYRLIFCWSKSQFFSQSFKNSWCSQQRWHFASRQWSIHRSWWLVRFGGYPISFWRITFGIDGIDR